MTRSKAKRRWPALGPLAALTCAATVVAVAGPAGSALASATGRPARATAWVAVPYRSAQLSVPGSWLVQAPAELSCGITRPTGMIFTGIRPGIPKGQGCGLTANLAWIIPAGQIPKGIGHRKPSAVIGGFPVYRLPSGKGSVRYLVPDLRVRIGARGPKARRVLATLTRSPLSAVLRPGKAGQAPAGWTWQRFGGVRFATPATWDRLREHQWATCGTGVDPSTRLLVNATKPPLALPCAFQPPTAAADQAQPGLAVLTGRYAAKSVDEHFGRCLVRRHVKICLSSMTGQGGLFGGVLIFSASRPHHHAGTYFLLGLSGAGARARAVFDSVELPAR